MCRSLRTIPALQQSSGWVILAKPEELPLLMFCLEEPIQVDFFFFHRNVIILKHIYFYIYRLIVCIGFLNIRREAACNMVPAELPTKGANDEHGDEGNPFKRVPWEDLPFLQWPSGVPLWTWLELLHFCPLFSPSSDHRFSLPRQPPNHQELNHSEQRSNQGQPRQLQHTATGLAH